MAAEDGYIEIVIVMEKELSFSETVHIIVTPSNSSTSGYIYWLIFKCQVHNMYIPLFSNN